MKRRQYSSCDACRASKRGCHTSASTPEGVPAATCPNCQRLGLTCTYNFASTKRNSPQKSRNEKKGRANTFSVSLLPRHQAPSETGVGGTGGDACAPWQPLAERDGDLMTWTNVPSGDRRFDPSLNPSHPPYGLSGACVLPWDDASDQIGGAVPPVTGSTYNIRYDQQSGGKQKRPLENLSPYGPVGLLNLSWDSNAFADQLRKISKTILSVCSVSFLCYGCNLISTGRQYWYEESADLKPSIALELEFDILDAFTDSSKLPLWRRSPPRDHASPFPRSGSHRATYGSGPRHDLMYKMTQLGNVRFLDHFGELYGNRLDQVDHEKSDILLRDVMIAFATQWMASVRSNSLGSCPGGRCASPTELRQVTDLGANAYLDNWFKAQASIQKYHSIRSFRVILALILFDMITVPVQISSPERPQSTANLDHGIRQVRVLEKLVKNYCNTLPPHSKYGNVLQASLDIVCWFAFCRDSTSSLISDRKCQYQLFFKIRQTSLKPKLVSDCSDQADLLASTDTIDVKYLDICKEAISEMFLIWRRIDELPSLSGDDDLNRLTFEMLDSDKVALTMEAIDNYERIFGGFMKQCFENYSNLSISTTSFSAFLVIHWNLGVLTFAEYLQRAQRLLPPLSRLTMASKTYQYNWCAVQSIAAIVSNLVLASSNEDLFHKTGIAAAIPVYSYHATTHSILRSLYKAIEVAVELHNADVLPSGPVLGNVFNSDHENTWWLCVKSLLKSLIALEASAWGTHSARAALHGLMQRYGDVLTACWMFDEVPPSLGAATHNMSSLSSQCLP